MARKNLYLSIERLKSDYRHIYDKFKLKNIVAGVRRNGQSEIGRLQKAAQTQRLNAVHGAIKELLGDQNLFNNPSRDVPKFKNKM